MLAPGLLAEGAELENVAPGGATWAEGPLWLPTEQVVIWSDIIGNRILQFDPSTGIQSVRQRGVEHTNGRCFDAAGAIVQCSHGRRALERVRLDGSVETLADAWNGVRLNAPNDVALAPDGALWFTDPRYGITNAGEGHPGRIEYGDHFVFRVDLEGGLTAVVTDVVMPNGICFSPDGSLVYVADSSGPEDGVGGGTRSIRVYDVDGGRRAKSGRVFAAVSSGFPDGIRADVDGRLWASSAAGVEVFAPDGSALGLLPVPETVANLVFGGPDGHDLYITATTSLYRIRTATRAATFS